MNKIELARALQEARGCSMAEATEMLNVFIKVLTEQLAQDEPVNLQGFGSLRPWHQKSRLGRNPRTGTPATIPSRISVKFHPGKLLREALNKKK